MNEFDIINTFFQRPIQSNFIKQSVGDDCALLEVPDGYQLAFSMDTLVAGRHFPESATAVQVAQRAFCTCLSDLAAMGAKPLCFTLALTLPEADPHWLADFSQALLTMADDYQCELVGGDTTQGPLVISLQVQGLVRAQRALTRDAARSGDRIFVTGTLGDGAAALKLLMGKPPPANVAIDAESTDYLKQRFYQPQPQVSAGLLLLDYACAAIDISDGLLADLTHIARASQVSMEIVTEKIPLSIACKAIAGEQALDFALTGGDDYQLAFTVPEKNYPAVLQLIHSKRLHATEIGRVLDRGKVVKDKDSPVLCLKNGRPLVIKKPMGGYQHFAS